MTVIGNRQARLCGEGMIARRSLRARARSLYTLVLGLLPDSSMKKAALNRLGGWQVHPTARMAPCVLLNVHEAWLGPNTLLGPSIVFNIRRFILEENAAIGYWNWVSAAPTLYTPALASTPGVAAGEFRVGESASVTSRHYIDCSGGVRIGAFSVLAGVRSTILTHQVNTDRSEQELRPVELGEYCLVGSNTKLVPGAVVPSRCTVAMGAVVIEGLKDEGVLYAGVPARRVKELPTGRYFIRTRRWVDIPS